MTAPHTDTWHAEGHEVIPARHYSIIARLFYAMRAWTERPAGEHYRRTHGAKSYSHDQLVRLAKEPSSQPPLEQWPSAG